MTVRQVTMDVQLSFPGSTAGMARYHEIGWVAPYAYFKLFVTDI